MLGRIGSRSPVVRHTRLVDMSSHCRLIQTGVRLLFDSEDSLKNSGLLLDTLGFERVGGQSSSSTRHQHYGLNLDLVVNPQLGKIRSVFSAGTPFSHVLGIDFYPALINPYLKDKTDLGMIDILELAALGLGSGNKSKKSVPMKVHHDCDETAPRFTKEAAWKSKSVVDALDIVRPREIVIPLRENEAASTTMSTFDQLGIQPLGNKLPGLFKSPTPGDEIIFRLVPCSTMGLMLQVKSIEHAESFLLENGIPHERLGNELSQRELQVLDPSLSQAVDIRLSENQTPNLFWREGSTAVIGSTTMQSMHNARVLAGQDAGKEGEEKAELDRRTLNSDCWMETRERVKSGVLR